MAKGTKKPTKPLLDFTVDPLKELKGVQIRTSLHGKIELYGAFCKEAYGKEPDKSAIVDGIIERFFAEDDAFKEFEKRHEKSAAKPGGAAAAETPGG
jgi:hypothetical protein